MELDAKTTQECCRYCLVPTSDIENDKLVHVPCRCTGSIGFVHPSCHQKTNTKFCTICKTRYPNWWLRIYSNNNRKSGWRQPRSRSRPRNLPPRRPTPREDTDPVNTDLEDTDLEDDHSALPVANRTHEIRDAFFIVLLFLLLLCLSAWLLVLLVFPWQPVHPVIGGCIMGVVLNIVTFFIENDI